MAKVCRYSATEMCILESMKLELQMGMVNITGTVEHSIVDSSYQEWDTAEESGKWCKETLIKANIWMIRRMVEVLTSGKAELNT